MYIVQVVLLLNVYKVMSMLYMYIAVIVVVYFFIINIFSNDFAKALYILYEAISVMFFVRNCCLTQATNNKYNCAIF